jgi:hypothetical protein
MAIGKITMQKHAFSYAIEMIHQTKMLANFNLKLLKKLKIKLNKTKNKVK